MPIYFDRFLIFINSIILKTMYIMAAENAKNYKRNNRIKLFIQNQL